jgi:hypothetical protein
MITAFVQISLPAPIPRDEVIAAFEASAPSYKGAKGLLLKYYLYDGIDRVGGFYVWKDRTIAEAVHTKIWLKNVGDRYGAKAEISYFEVPLLIDNT